MWTYIHVDKLRLMTFEKMFCSRCTRLTNCMILSQMAFCEHCLEILCLDFETKKTMETLMIHNGIREL